MSCGMGLFIPVSYLGAGLGARAVDQIPQRCFRQVIAAFLILLALKLIVAS